MVSKVFRSRPFELVRVAVAKATDRLYGMRTEESVSLEAFGLAHPNRLLYVPSSWKSYKVLAKVLHPKPDDTFVDLGSGKGRVVMMVALRLALRRVVGVEISADLTAVAAENLARMRPKLKTPDVELICTDATAFRMPDDMTIAYIYSSFTGPIFQAVLQSIRDNLQNFTGSRLMVVLQRPTNGTPRDHVLATNDDYLQAQPWLKPLARIKMRSITGWRSEMAFYCAFDKTQPDRGGRR